MFIRHLSLLYQFNQINLTTVENNGITTTESSKVVQKAEFSDSSDYLTIDNRKTSL